MSGSKCTEWLGSKGRFLVAFAVAIAAAVLFHVGSQAAQDERIQRNRELGLVIDARLDAIDAKLADIRQELRELRKRLD